MSTEEVSTRIDVEPMIASRANLRQRFSRLLSGDKRHFLFSFATTITCFGLFFLQGIFIARMLGPEGRGEFGSALYFPRDILLYAGLLGAVEIFAGNAARRQSNNRQLKLSAIKFGLLTGVLTGLVAAAISCITFVAIGKSFVIPFCLLVCLFLPFEHVHHTISSVDRGQGSYTRYNINRLLFTVTFPILILVVWQTELASALGISNLLLACLTFIVARIIGLLPTLCGWKLRAALAERRSDLAGSDLPRTGQLLNEGRPYALSMIISEAFDRMDIFLVLALADMVTAGHYFVAVPAAALLIMAPNTLAIFTFNAGANKDFVPSIRNTTSIIVGMVLFQIVACLIMEFLVGFLIKYAFSDSYLPSIPFAMWLIPAAAIKGLLQATDGYLKGRERPACGIWARMSGIVVMLIFVALLYPRFEIIAIPMAACISQLFSFVLVTTGLYRDIIQQNRNQNL